MPECHLCGQQHEGKASYCARCGANVGGGGAAAVPALPEWAATHLGELLELSRALSLTLDSHLLLKKVDSSATKLTGATAGSIMLFDEDRKALRFRSLSGERSTTVESLPVQSGIAWWVATHGKSARVNDAAKDERFTATLDDVSGFETRSVLCVPVELEDEVIGVIEVLNKVSGVDFTEDDEQLLSVLAGQAAVAVKNARSATEQRNFLTHVIEILVMAIESTCLVPEGHCWRVAKLATAVGRNLGMEEEDLQDLYYAAVLHDLGLLSLRQDTVGEEDRKRLHPILGADMVKTIDILHGTEPIIRYHHEYFDGSGYPDGLRGSEIPLGARILGVVEAYEEAVAEAGNQGQATSEIRAMSGNLLDRALVDEFLDLVAVYES